MPKLAPMSGEDILNLKFTVVAHSSEPTPARNQAGQTIDLLIQHIPRKTL